MLVQLKLASSHIKVYVSVACFLWEPGIQQRVYINQPPFQIVISITKTTCPLHLLILLEEPNPIYMDQVELSHK